MFEGMKLEAYNEGYKDGKKNGEVFAAARQCPDTNGITYATQGDYMKAKVAFNAKDTEIADLKNKVKSLKDSLKGTGTEQNALEADLAKCRKELEQFYLKAIGDCKTVKQVEAVLKRYHESESFKAWVSGVMAETFMVSLFSGKQITPKGSQVDQAAATKIKRINTKDTRQLCTMLDTAANRTLYASSIATALKGIADIEVDMTKVLAAKDTGLDAWNVLLSMLSAYGVKADSVLEVK